MSRRALTTPPLLAGFEYVSLIGSGGYAEVFLYQQAMPNRRVAIKVLDTASLPDGAGQSDFTAEANLMASVSAHPYIVQVFHAAIAPDGRPYLIMEFYSGPNFYERARSEKMSVAEALRVGVQLSSAVEAAHRVGILHRDIKPANVLTSEYRRPGLTDFGIASVQGPETDTADGVSIPWSPPEALGDAPADRRSDVYSLAATVYTLVAGRSPFEIPGGDNRHLALIGRIERNPVPPIGRPDVPASLERVLAGAMSKDPAYRPATAAEFGRQLQSVESEMHLAVTELDLADEQRSARSRVDDDDDSTRVKGVTEVRAQEDRPSVPIAAVPERPRAGGSIAPREREGMLGEPDVDETMHRAPAQQAEPSGLAAPAGVDRKWLIAGGIAAALIAVVLGAALLGGGGDSGEVTQQIDESQINDNIGQPIAVTPSPLQQVAATDNGDGSFTFSWEDRGDGFTYAVTPDGAAAAERVDQPTFDALVECIEVEVIADSGLISAPTRGCG